MEALNESLTLKNEIENNGKRLFIYLAKYTLLTLLIILLSTTIIAASYAVYDDFQRTDELAKGISIAGINVSNQNIDDAETQLREEFESKYKQELIFNSGTESWKVNPSKFSFKLDYKKMIKSAYIAGYENNIVNRIYNRFTGKEFKKDIPIAFNYDQKAVNEYLEVLAFELNSKPRDAFIEVGASGIVIHPEQEGLTLDIKSSSGKVAEKLISENRNVELSIRRTPAAFTVSQIDKIIVIKRGERKLYFYQKDKLIKAYPIAVGQPSFPTPYGDWSVVGKRRNPAWYNPKSGWSKNMPAIIPPGPSNPLGTRAIELNAPAIRIHGTSSPGSIGRAASHGCIRMFRADVEALFEMVPIGTPVFIR